MHAAAARRRAMHQHHAAFGRAARSRIEPESELRAISSRGVTDFRQIREVHALEWIIDTRHRAELAWSAQGNRQSNDRRKHRHCHKNTDEKMLHRSGLTRTS